MRALVQRIDRRLAKDDQRLGATRSTREGMSNLRLNLGAYYVVDTNRNFVVATHVSPEDLGRELGVLKDWEALTEDEE
jgi:putative component of toxin-antitoxin plasmid stabilization module